MKYAFKHPARQHARHLTHLALAYHADEKTGRCWPGIPTLCRETGLSRPAVFQAIDELLQLGTIAIQKYKGPHRTHMYTVKTLNGKEAERLSSLTLTVKQLYPNLKEPPEREEEEGISASLIYPTGKEEPTKQEGSEPLSHSTQKAGRPIPKKTKSPHAPTLPSLAWWQTDELKDDVVFLAALKVHPDHLHVNMDVQLKESAAYQAKKGRTWSRGFFMKSWLSRCEKPMQLPQVVRPVVIIPQEFLDAERDCRAVLAQIKAGPSEELEAYTEEARSIGAYMFSWGDSRGGGLDHARHILSRARELLAQMQAGVSIVAFKEEQSRKSWLAMNAAMAEWKR